MAKPIEIYDIQFNSQKAAENHTQELLSRYNYGAIIEGNDFGFFCCLIERHEKSEEKIGVGIKELQVRKNPNDLKSKVIYIHRTDGSEIDFSWRKCIKPPSPLSRVLNAARFLISTQVEDVKNQCFAKDQTHICPETGIMIDRELSATDHQYPQTFDRIFKDWCVSENLDSKDIETISIQNSRRTFKNEILNNSWIAFHQQHASLRVIHRTANLSLGKGPSKSFENIYLEIPNEDEIYESYREREL